MGRLPYRIAEPSAETYASNLGAQANFMAVPGLLIVAEIAFPRSSLCLHQSQDDGVVAIMAFIVMSAEATFPVWVSVTVEAAGARIG